MPARYFQTNYLTSSERKSNTNRSRDDARLINSLLPSSRD